MDNLLMSVEHLDMCFSTRRGNITALNDLSFEVERGEFLAIVGPSGCGKSTLINKMCIRDRIYICPKDI